MILLLLLLLLLPRALVGAQVIVVTSVPCGYTLNGKAYRAAAAIAAAGRRWITQQPVRRSRMIHALAETQATHQTQNVLTVHNCC